MRKAQSSAKIFWPAVVCVPWMCYVCYLFLVSTEQQTIYHPSDVKQSIALILPVTPISHLDSVLRPLVIHSLPVNQIALLCSQDALQTTRSTIRALLSASNHSNHLEFLVLPLLRGVSQVSAVLHARSQLTADKVILLGEHGLNDVDQHVQDLLISRTYSLPFGPRGFSSGKPICPTSPEEVHTVSFLVPPFAIPSSILHDIQDTDTWQSFGSAIANQRGDGVGGIAIGTSTLRCFDSAHIPSPPSIASSAGHPLANSPGTFALLLPTLDDLRAFSGPACRLQATGNKIHVLLYEERLGQNIEFRHCHLSYQALAHDSTTKTTLTWLNSIHPVLDVVFAITEENPSGRAVSSVISHIHSTLIRLPRRDLSYCDWIGSLTVQELQNWHLPRIDVSVITNDRPRSLARLLMSLHKARYFGDALNLRVNLEQDSDPETLQIVKELHWDHGSIIINHRIIHGGLLPAVVESWYPHSNDSYGLILEDDVELSPLFYAWVKMSILRYRYGKEEDRSPELFGISLYQQKNVELKPGGRQLFNPRTIFAAKGLTGYNTPYLSQIPCSWGAIYFPEHWREFHSYLSVRLSELSFDIDQVVVPDVRSNKWTRSWKKYFIELVYLRGYLMLYPNYDHFTSLSTNHLEVGSHVRESPRDSYVQKKEQFLVPLMPLSDQGGSMLLDLPGNRLPPYTSLPALDLLGDIAPTEVLLKRGLFRRTQLLPSCTIPRTMIPYDIRDLFCLDTTPL